MPALEERIVHVKSMLNVRNAGTLWKKYEKIKERSSFFFCQFWENNISFFLTVGVNLTNNIWTDIVREMVLNAAFAR